MFKSFPKELPVLSQWLTIFLGLLFLAYCAVYLCACPSKELACAVGAEALGLLISITVLRTRLFAFPDKWKSKLPAIIKSFLESSSDILSSLKLAILSCISIIALIDFTALSLAICHQYVLSIALYTILPLSYWLGLHPAISLEMIAGALVQSGNYDRAEALFQEVKSIRLKLAGPRSDLASAIYADLGDLNVRRGRLGIAESCYRQSVALGAHTGRSYTGLATVLRELARFDESKQNYETALALRKRIYGSSSKQYQDTLKGYLTLQDLIKRDNARLDSAKLAPNR